MQLPLLSVKRYGRNLGEGISGFYLDFESRIPVYQIFYLVKKAETPWGILTNGKNWILFRRPRVFEKRLIELDLGKEETGRPTKRPSISFIISSPAKGLHVAFLRFWRRNGPT